MALTTAQIATLKADILADGVLNATPNNGDGYAAIIAAYQVLVTVPANFFVWATNVALQAIYDQIVWANLTPTDAPDTTQLWLNRAMLCQSKQFNIQIILQGQQSINASKSNVRAGLQDALLLVPSGASGAQQSAGWVNVRDNALARKANRLEKLFATGGNGSTAQNSATMNVEGVLTPADVESARNS